MHNEFLSASGGDSRFRAVIFDLGNVLVDFRYNAYMTELGFPEEVQDFFRKEIILSPLWCRMDRGELGISEAAEQLVERFGSYESEIRSFFSCIEGIVREYPDSEGLVRKLKENGYLVYILSNYPEELYEMHRDSWKFLPLTDGAVISGKEKMGKPDAAFYRLLLDRYNLTAEECIFLDDREDNVLAARQSGIETILVNHREEAFRTLLEKLALRG